MFILKILMKLVLFPLVLILFFLRIWVELLYKIGEVAFGLFCISIQKYDEAEEAYRAAAEVDESLTSSLYSEFAIEYYNNVMAQYAEIMEDPKARAPYAKKALQYMLLALDIDAEEAKSLL